MKTRTIYALSQVRPVGGHNTLMAPPRVEGQQSEWVVHKMSAGNETWVFVVWHAQAEDR